FLRGHQAASSELAPRAAESRSARDPDHRLQIAQTTGTFLDIGLEVVRRILKSQVTLLLLQRLRFEKRSRVEGRIETSAKPLVERARSREQSLLEQAGPGRDIARHLGLALVDRAHCM